jgi:hypothetical protein
MIIELQRAQMQTMASHCCNHFERRLLQHLRKSFPDETQEKSDKMLFERTRHAVRKAGKYGIEMESDVVRFVDLTFLLGADFDSSPETPWASEILNDKTLTGSQKAELLWNRANEELARAAELTKQSNR